MYQFMDIVLVSRAQCVRNGNTGTDRQADKEIDDEIGQRAGRADSGQCRLSIFGESANHYDIGGIIKQLKYTREQQRQGEHDNFTEERSLDHIDFFFDSLTFDLCTHFPTLSYSCAVQSDTSIILRFSRLSMGEEGEIQDGQVKT